MKGGNTATKVANWFSGGALKSRDDEATAVSKLNDFIGQVNAQSGNHIPATAADELIADAQEILDLLGG